MFVYALSAFIATVICSIVVLLEKWRRLVHLYSSQGIKSPPGIPLFGNSLMLERGGHEVAKQIEKMMHDYNFAFLLWLGPSPLFMTSRAEDAKILLNSTKAITKAKEYAFLEPWLEEGLLLSDGGKWRKRRKMITPTFHFGILKNYESIIKTDADIFISKLEPLAKTGEVFDITPYVTMCTLDIICETAMGVSLQAQNGDHKECVEAHARISSAIQERQRSPWLWPDWIYRMTTSGKKHDAYVKTLHDFTDNVVFQRVQERNSEKLKGENHSTSKEKLFFLDMLINNYEKQEIDIQGLQEEVYTFMMGFHTASQGIGFAVFFIGKNPEIQKKLQEEIAEKCGNDVDKIVECIKEMSLLERVIKEGLRLCPAVPLIGRSVNEDLKLGDLVFYKGATIALNILWLHRNPAYWEEPMKFDPDRFLPEKSVEKNSFKYVPFSAGPRNCIGDLVFYKGATIALNIVWLHRNPAYWEEPMKFDPDRFLPEKCVERNNFEYVPFSAGSRNCIGQKFAILEDKIILATLLYHYEITTVGDLKLVGEIILRSRDGVKVFLKRRNENSSI